MRAKEFINETASVGGTASGGIATVPSAMGTMQRRKKRIGEAHDDEMVAVDFNNESAMELAQSKFDFDWDGDQMIIHEKHLGRLEELLDDNGYFEPDDYEIEPAMFAAEGTTDVESKFDALLADVKKENPGLTIKSVKRNGDIINAIGIDSGRKINIEYNTKTDKFQVKRAGVNEGMADGYAYEVYVGEPRTGKVKVGRKTIDFDAIRLANPNGRGHLKKRGIVYAQNREQALQKARQQYGKTAQVEPYMG